MARRRPGLVGRGGPLIGLDPFPLAVDVRRGPRLGVAEHVRMAADDLRRDRGLDVGEVEHAGLGGELGVEHDLQPQVAELAGQLGRGPGCERVVDLVRLLEQVLAQRFVGLLAVPRAAVRAGAAGRRSRASPTGRRGPAPGATGRGRAAPRAIRPASDPTVAPSAAAEPTDRVVGRVEPPDELAADRSNPARRGRAAARPPMRFAIAGPEHRERHEQDRPRRLDRAREQALGGDDLQPVGGIEPPAEPRLRDERVEHPAPLA